LPQLCIAVVPINPRCQGWLPCTRPRASRKQLCAAHYAAFAGVILGFQTQLKLPELPFVDPHIIKRLYAQEKKSKHRRIARQRQRPRQQSCATRDCRGTALHGGQACQRRARTSSQHGSAIKHSCAPQPSAPGESTIAIEEARDQTQAIEAAITTGN
jgi:hypothetical protein